MISKAKQKLVRSLQQKKYRQQEGLFVAEGPKVVGDLMAAYKPKMLVATAAYLHRNPVAEEAGADVFEVTDEELRQTSFLQHPQEVLGVFPMPSTAEPVDADVARRELCLVLDGVQDPGNVGTIIRIADWFGIEHVFCSHETADVWNPKVVQATMGSIARVKVRYTDITVLLKSLGGEVPVYGTLLDGQDIYRQQLSGNGIIVMGNEGNGISEDVRRLVNRKLLIPNYPAGRPTADSLNVAIATAITCAEFRRRMAE